MNKEINIELLDEVVDIQVSQIITNDVRTERTTVKSTTETQIVEPHSGKYFDRVTVEPLVADSIKVKSSKEGIITIEPEEGSFFNEVIVDKIELEDKTIYPSLQEQVIKSNKDGLETVTVRPVGSWIDSDIKPENIRNNVNILGVTGTMGANSEIKYANADTTQVKVEPSKGVEFLKAVYINPVGSYIDGNIKSENIKNGVSILGVEGNYEGDNRFQSKEVNPSTSKQVVRPDTGYNFLDKVTVNEVTSTIDENIIPENIKTGTTILGVRGTFGGAKRQTKTVYPTTSYQVIRPDSGFDVLTQVNIQPVTNSIDGNIKSENIKKGVNILGIGGTLDEIKSEEVLVNPSKYSQTITPTPGKNAISKVRVNPVTYEIDSNIKSSNIKKDTTILGVLGTYEGATSLQEKIVNPSSDIQEITPDSNYDALSKVTVNAVETEVKEITPSKHAQTINPSEGKFIERVEIGAIDGSDEPNLIPENIRENISIYGVTGSFSGGGEQQYFSSLSYGTSSLPGIVNSIQYIPTTTTTGTSGDFLFYNLKKLVGLDNQDFSNFTSARNMFNGCTSLVNVNNIKFDVNKPVDCFYMFYNCTGLTGTLNMVSMGLKAKLPQQMFYNCTNLNKIIVDWTLNETSSAGGMYLIQNRPFNNVYAELEFTPTSHYCKQMFNGYKGTKVGLILADKWNGVDIEMLGSSADSAGGYTRIVEFGGFKDLGKGFTTDSGLPTQYSPSLNVQSIINIIDNVYDMNLTQYTAKLWVKTALYNQLPEEKKQLAISKDGK